jgi:hypothetical protein
MPGEAWIVEWVNATARWCGCPAFQRAQCCYHVEEVAALIQQEVRALTAASTPASRAAAKAKLAELEELFSR